MMTTTIDGWRFLSPLIGKDGKPIDGVYVRRPPQSENSKRVMKSRYFSPGDNDYNDICSRVALTLSDVESDDKILLLSGVEIKTKNMRKQQFEDVMKNREFIPAGRTLRNAGSGDNSKVVPNCIVLNLEDSMNSILDTLAKAGKLQKAGSGLGFPFSELRPTGSKVVRSSTISSGPVSFMDAYNKVFNTIKQQNRHGANMGVMRVDHPDILDFISSKKDEGMIKNFNISVAITDKFMRDALDPKKRKEPWHCFFNEKEYPIHKVKRN